MPSIFSVLTILIIFFAIGCLGTIIELTQVGNRRDIIFKDEAVLNKYSTWNKRLLL